MADEHNGKGSRCSRSSRGLKEWSNRAGRDMKTFERVAERHLELVGSGRAFLRKPVEVLENFDGYRSYRR